MQKIVNINKYQIIKTALIKGLRYAFFFFFGNDFRFGLKVFVFGFGMCLYVIVFSLQRSCLMHSDEWHWRALFHGWSRFDNTLLEGS